eukprot:gene426-461_t
MMERAKHGSSHMPTYTEIHTVSPIAAGLPILEIVRKLEEEKILSREDRLALKDALYSPDSARREKVVQALCAVELSLQSRNAILRLKTVLYDREEPQLNAAGLVQSSLFNRGDGDGTRKQPKTAEVPEAEEPTSPTTSSLKKDELAPSKDKAPRISPKRVIDVVKEGEDGGEGDGMNVQDTVTKVVGSCPQYSGSDNFNVLLKIEKRIFDVASKLSLEKTKAIRFAVIVGSGSFNPLTRIHLRGYFLAKQYLESHCGYLVLGSLLSPSHSATVRERYRTNPMEVLPAPHRLAIAQLLVESSQFLSIDPWEITRRRAMDYLSLLEHSQNILKIRFPDFSIKLFYMTKPNNVVMLSPQALRSQSFHVIAVCRSYETDALRSQLGSKWNGIITVVEDSAILDASLDQVTSRRVRDKIKLGESVEQLVGSKINDYVIANHIQQKLNGTEVWTTEEKSMPKILSRGVQSARKAGSINDFSVSDMPPLTEKKESDRGISESAYVPSWVRRKPS